MIAATIALYVYCLATVPIGSAAFETTPSDRQLSWTLTRADLAAGQWWRLVTSGFVHLGVVHVGVSMFVLWQLGRIVEPIAGRARFALLFITTLLAGSAGAMFVAPDTVHAGSTGVIFGLAGAVAISPRWRIHVDSQARVGLGISLLILLVYTPAVGLSLGGPIGGLVGGTVAGTAMGQSTPEGRQPLWTMVAALVVALMSIAIAVLVAGRAGL